MKHERFFRTHPVFTRGELSEYLATAGEVAPRTAEALLAYHTGQGNIMKLRKGLYAVVQPGYDPAVFRVDPYLVASRLADDAAIACHTALEFHGRAYTVHNDKTYAASRPFRPFVLQGRAYRGISFPQALVKTGRQHYGTNEEDRAGSTILVTSLDRTLVDVLDRPQISGGWEEIWRSLEMVEFFNLDTVLEYVEMLGNATTAAKVGFFLAIHRERLMVADAYLTKLAALRPTSPHYLDRTKRSPGRLVPRWNLIVPEEVFTRSWEEVL